MNNVSWIERLFQSGSENASVTMIILSITVMLFLGFIMTRVTGRLKLPNVTAYIVTGILIGPFVLNIIPKSVTSGMSFLSDIALAFIAFSTGEFFQFETLKKNGVKVVVITLVESCLTTLAVFCVSFFVLRIPLAFAVVLAALAAATAPASTVMTIRQTGAKGDFVNTLLQVVALDDAVGLVLYSAAISIALASASGQFRAGSVLRPILINLLVLALGCLFGAVMKWMMPTRRTTDNRLIIAIALLFAFCGICAVLDVSPLLGCMSMGTVYRNYAGDDRLFMQLNYFTPPVLLLFFVHAGVSFRLDALFRPAGAIGHVPLLAVGVVYFVVRIIGKYAGAYLGCRAVGKDKKVRNFLGLALIPQAGVAIGLAMLGARTLGGETGMALQTIILASSVLYELVGPACAKAALFLSGSYSDQFEEFAEAEAVTENDGKKSEADLLAERIRAIELEMKEKEGEPSAEEAAFTEAAEEQIAALYGEMRQNKIAAGRKGRGRFRW